jgi:class 3 adenylate cyclase
MRERLGPLGLRIRAGIHIGECNVRGDDVSGLAVHLASRLLSQANPGEIVVSRTVKDLLVGSEFQFGDKGTAPLKGIPGEWQIYYVA